MLTFDYETDGIVGNPIYNPPKPCGVSIKYDNDGSKYWAWGHPTGNNCTWEEGRKKLLQAMRDHQQWLAHNAPFEAAVSRKWFKVSKRNPLHFHDTQYLIFMYNPYASSLSLKPSAERILGIPPDEQEELKDWILRNVPGATSKEWGAYISKAPGDLVGKYAGNSEHTGVPGDTDRTKMLFDQCYAFVEEHGMLDAYHRELALAPTLSESSVRGVRVDTATLERDIHVYTAAKKMAEDKIHRVLGDFNIDSDRELAAALDKAGQVTEWVLTPTGKRSTARKNLVGRVRDGELLDYLAYRGVLETCLGTFAEPWLASASAHQGRVHPQWNQVRGDRGSDGDLSGTRTGRMSCRDPNLQNPPNDFESLVVPRLIAAFFGKQRATGWVGSDIIHMRRYLLPEEGHTWVKRDFSSQEMRIMAHFAEGKLYEAYLRDPSVDPHAMVQAMLKDMLGIDLPRKFLKIIAFGIMYGRGIPNLSAALGVDEAQGKAFREAYYQLLPEIKDLAGDCRRRGRMGGHIRTWGGRIYFREPHAEGRDLSYKLLNYLIQGSAADQTKQAMVDWRAEAPPEHMLLAAVHDEINLTIPTDDVPTGMRILRETMDADRFDVPFRSEGFCGPNWSELEDYEA